MTEAIVLDPSLQKRLVANANQNNLSIDELLNDALDYYLRVQDEKKLKEEIVAYEAMHDELWKTHPMEWVAFYEQQMVDHDPDKLTLHRRIRTNYPDI